MGFLGPEVSLEGAPPGAGHPSLPASLGCAAAPGGSPSLSAGVFRCGSLGAGPGDSPSAGFRVWPGSVPVIASPWDLVSPLQKAAWEPAEEASGRPLMQTPHYS